MDVSRLDGDEPRTTEIELKIIFVLNIFIFLVTDRHLFICSSLRATQNLPSAFQI